MLENEAVNVGEVARRIAATLNRAGSGDLASLRRMSDTRTAPAFWRMSAAYGIEDRWKPFVRMLAHLTPTGDPLTRDSIYDAEAKLGRVLCDGGDAGWSKAPVVSETRLARMLAARGDQRVRALERTIRGLSRHHPKIDVADLAWAVLNPKHGDAIAKHYYRRLDAAQRQNQKEEGQDA